jgi:DegV family protein with EDD domain
MNKIAVVTDSTANLKPEIAEAYDIAVIPLKVHWGDKTYVDGVTLSAETFYQWLEEREDPPKTSQPSVGEFIQFFEEVAERYQTDTILGTFISAELSGTMASATQAKAQLPHLNITLVDTRFVSMAAGFQALCAARASRAGASVDDILAHVQQVRAHTDLLFTVDTLDYLRRGGRIGGAAHLLGTLLNLKPLLTIQGGVVEALSKSRGRQKSLQVMSETIQERLAGRHPPELAIMHTGVEGDEDVAQLTSWVTEHLKPQRLYTGLFSPVVGTHGGPRTIGITFHLGNSCAEDVA